MTYKSRLVGYWPLDEDSGSTAYDYSGNENNGTANGAGPAGTGTASGPLEATAYDFDGTDDYINIPNYSEFAAYSLSSWAKFDTINDSTNHHIISIRVNNAIQLREDGNGSLISIHKDSGGTNQQVSGSISQDAWIHCASTWDGSTLKLYIDGEEVDSKSVSGVTQVNEPEDTIGSSYAGGSNGEYIDGKIGGVRIYDRALSPPEIQYLYEVSNRARLRTSTKTA